MGLSMGKRAEAGSGTGILEWARRAFVDVANAQGILDNPVRILARTLSAEEAVGTPHYDDLPLLRGKEVMIEAEFRDARGHAFTSAPSSWSGSIAEMLELSLANHRERALLAAGMNAVLRSSGAIGGTVHCHSEDITRCGELMAADLRREFGAVPVGVVGYQPGLAVGLATYFGSERVRIVDLLPENIGRCVHGIDIWDGASRMADLVRSSQLVLATGSTAANGTLDDILRLSEDAGAPVILYGVTAAALCHLCGIRRACLLGN